MEARLHRMLAFDVKIVFCQYVHVWRLKTEDIWGVFHCFDVLDGEVAENDLKLGNGKHSTCKWCFQIEPH